FQQRTSSTELCSTDWRFVRSIGIASSHAIDRQCKEWATRTRVAQVRNKNRTFGTTRVGIVSLPAHKMGIEEIRSGATMGSGLPSGERANLRSGTPRCMLPCGGVLVFAVCDERSSLIVHK